MTIENNNEGLFEFITNHRKKGETTHTLMGSPKGAYTFDGYTYEQFMVEYVKEITRLKDGGNSPYELTFIERPNPVTFLYIDIDLNQRQRKRKYTKETILKIIGKINSILEETFVVNENQFISMITEKPGPTMSMSNDEKYYKDGFHIYYPYLPMSVHQRYYMIDNLTKCIDDEDFFEDVPYFNEKHKIFDKSIVESNGIFMYLSSKPGIPPYELTYVFNKKLEELNLNKYDDYEELVYEFSNRRYDIDSAVECHEEKEKEVTETGSIYKNKENKIKTVPSPNNFSNDHDSESEKQTKQYTLPQKKNGIFDKIKQSEIELAKKLIYVLNKKRCEDYNTWKRVGFALYAVDPGLFETFVNFSKRCMNKFKENKVTCEEIWKAAPKYSINYSIITLKYWARIDDEKEFYKILVSTLDDLFATAESGEHIDLAVVIHGIFKDRFVCIDFKKNKWYEYRTHRWKLIPDGHSLQTLIAKDIRSLLIKYCSAKMKICADDDDDEKKELRMKKCEKMMKSIKKLGNIQYLKNIMEACKTEFYDEDFQSKLDMDPYLIGFENGIYDLRDHCFRDGLPSDYISVSTKIDFKYYDIEDPIIKDLLDFFKKVYHTEDLIEYFLTLIASVWKGTPDQKFYFLTGEGGNGKSAVIALLRHMLGDYFDSLPTSFVTQKRGKSNDATPELVGIQYRRLLVLQEPEWNDVINMGVVKEITGCDPVSVRPLYGEKYTVLPKNKLCMICNILPKIRTQDRGTWRRNRVISHKTEFVESIEESNPKERKYLGNEELFEELSKWAQPLAWLSLETFYPKYENGIDGKKFKIKEPIEVLISTHEYKKDSDVFLEFISKNLKKADIKFGENIQHIYICFRNWFDEAYSKSDKVPPQKDLVKYLKNNKYKISEDGQEVFGLEFSHLINK
jgi:P4 family phage/plasmid primase-like protien